jgi:TetR/AcrR family fatty acid metabolism transcriptional regulator
MTKQDTPEETENERKLEIIAAARKVFSKYGYRKTAMVDIAKEVGLNQATLYHYFKNKEDVFIEKILADHTEFREKRKRLVAEEVSTQGKITAFFALKMEFFFGISVYEQIAELNYSKIPENHRKELDNLNRQEQEYIRSLLDSAIQNGELSSNIDATQLTKIIFRIFQGIRFEIKFNHFLSKQKLQREVLMKEMQQSIQYLFDNLRE